jgi:thiol-disulfide isomerase/thioredoxin
MDLPGGVYGETTDGEKRDLFPAQQLDRILAFIGEPLTTACRMPGGLSLKQMFHNGEETTIRACVMMKKGEFRRMNFTRNMLIAVLLVLLAAGAFAWSLGAKGDEGEPRFKPAAETVKQIPVSPAKRGMLAVCQGPELPEQGFCAPAFTLKTLDGGKVELAANGGKPTILNFWATWCPPCREEMPHFQEAYEKYHDRIRFLMVNETSQEESRETVQHFVEVRKFTFPVALDEIRSDRTTVGFDQYQLAGIPTTFVIDSQGKIVVKAVGGLTREQMAQVIRLALPTR